MTQGTLYLIWTQCCFVVLWLSYRMLFARYKTLNLNRFYLLAMVLASAVIPALSIPVWPAEPVQVTPEMTYAVSSVSPPVYSSGPVTVEPTSVDWIARCMQISVIGSMVMLFGLLHSGYRLWRLSRYSVVQRHADITIHHVETQSSAFSFFRHIYISSQSTHPQSYALMLAHEMWHVHLRHSWDILLFSLLKIIFWWNPFVWLWGRSLREIHEFQVDEALLCQGCDSEQYINLILQRLTDQDPELVSGFSYSLLKKRITMMTQNQTPHPAKWKMLLMLPILGSLMLCFSFTERNAVSENIMQVKPDTVSVTTSETSRIPDATVNEPRHAVYAKRDTATTNRSNGTVRKLKDTEQQLKATEQKLKVAEQELKHTKQKLDTMIEKFKDSHRLPHISGDSVTMYNIKDVSLKLNEAKQNLDTATDKVSTLKNLLFGNASEADLSALPWEIVVDGVSVKGPKNIDFSQIESITLLKDSAAKAYLKGISNKKVILITTKGHPNNKK